MPNAATAKSNFIHKPEELFAGVSLPEVGNIAGVEEGTSTRTPDLRTAVSSSYPAFKAVPSARQKLKLSSVYVVPQAGQFFIFYFASSSLISDRRSC